MYLPGFDDTCCARRVTRKELALYEEDCFGNILLSLDVSGSCSGVGWI